jgi:hypothetical protein
MSPARARCDRKGQACWGKRGAIYIDRLLKGARLADIPIEQEQEFKLLISGPLTLSRLCP